MMLQVGVGEHEEVPLRDSDDYGTFRETIIEKRRGCCDMLCRQKIERALRFGLGTVIPMFLSLWVRDSLLF